MPLTEEDLQFINGVIARYHHTKDEDEKRRIETELFYMDIQVNKPVSVPVHYEDFDDGA
jgi:hypothetical protein